MITKLTYEDDLLFLLRKEIKHQYLSLNHKKEDIDYVEQQRVIGTYERARNALYKEAIKEYPDLDLDKIIKAL